MHGIKDWVVYLGTEHASETLSYIKYRTYILLEGFSAAVDSGNGFFAKKKIQLVLIDFLRQDIFESTHVCMYVRTNRV